MNTMMSTAYCIGFWNQLIRGWVLFIYIFVDNYTDGADMYTACVSGSCTRCNCNNIHLSDSAAGGYFATRWYYVCLMDMPRSHRGDTSIAWFAEAVNKRGKFRLIKLMENLVRFRSFAG